MDHHTPRRVRAIWRPRLPLVFVVALCVFAQVAEPVPRTVSPETHDRARPAAERLDDLVLRSGPTPSGAEPPYPLNHTMDGETTALGAVQNSDFETPPSGVGSPPANSGMESSPADVATVTNGDFETGSFSGWTLTGSPTIQSDQTHGYWARMGSNNQEITSSAVTIPQSAQAMVADVYFQTSNSWVEIYVLSGPTYSTSTLAKSEYCSNCGWTSRTIDLSGYRTQSIKLKFKARFAAVGIDAVKIQQLFPNYDSSGSLERATSGSDHYAKLNGWLITDAFTIDETAQFASVELQGQVGTSQYNVAVATAPYSSWTTLSSGVAPTSWQAVSFNVSAYAGQQVKVRVMATYNWIWADDVFGSQSTELPGWSVSGTATRDADGTNHYVTSAGTLTSSATTLATTAQHVSFRLRSASTSSFVYVELLRGTGYSEVIELATQELTSSWATYTYGVSPYAGESVRLRVRKVFANPSFQLDDAGAFSQVLPGWSMTSTDAVQTATDAHGTYVSALEPEGAMFLRSSFVSPGVLDRTGFADRRYVAVSYDLTPNELMQVFWVEDGESSVTVFEDASSTQTGYTTSFFPVYDFMGDRGYFVVKMTSGGKLYSIGDNVARETAAEPFARKVGLGIDVATGSVSFADQDLSVPGPIPLSFTRYYNSHSDRYAEMGFRWSNTFDTHLEFAEEDEDVGVVFGSGREEFFDGDGSGAFSPADPRVHSSLIQNGNGTFTFTTKDNLDYAFTAQGRLSSITDLNGNALELSYDGQGRLSTVAGEGGVSLTLGYNGSGRLTSLTDPAGSAYTFAYDGAGDLVTATDPEGGVRTYTYSRHRLTSVTDEVGHLVVSNTYESVNRLTSQTDAAGQSIQVAHETPGKGATEITYPDGGVGTFYFDHAQRTTDTVDPSERVTSFLYDADGNLDKVIDSGSNEWDYAFDGSADLQAVQDPLGNPVSFDYNAKHLPVSITDARGNETTFVYDADGNLLTSTDPLGGVTTLAYDASGNVVSSTDPLGGETTFTYNAKGLKTSETDPLGNTTTFTYTALGKLTTETDPLDNTTTYAYDLLGRLVGITDPLGRTTTFLYDLVGHLLMVEDPAGDQTTWDYDDRGLVEAKIDPAGNSATYTYDDARRMTSMTNAEAETTSWGYDEAGRLTSTTDPLGNETAYTYDAEGRLSSVTDPLDRVTSHVYDDAGRLVQTTLPNAATVDRTYDADGNLLSSTDELDRVTAYAYDELSRLSSTTDPLGHLTTRDYDAAGRLVSVTDPLGHDTDYSYDAAGRMTSVTDPLGHATTYAYDDAGRRIGVTDATNRTTSYGYDAAGQLVSVTDPGGTETTSAYDDAGRLVSTASPLGNETIYAYDPRGLLLSVTDPLLHTTSYAYDDAGRMVSETDPTGAITTYGYDDAGRTMSLTDDLGGVVALDYDAAGQMTSTTDANGQTWSYDYNALGLRTLITDPLNRETEFGYDVAGQLTSRTDGRGITASYGYDADGQQTSETFPGGSVAYAYDAAGRRTSMSDATGTTTWTYDDAGRTTQVVSPEGTLGYSYDGAGRRASMTMPGSKTVTYAYNAAGLLGSVTDWRSQTTTFAYDAEGNRTELSRPNGVDTTYAYDAAGHVTEISHAEGAQELLGFEYTFDEAGRPTSVTSAEGTETYAYDALGRLIGVTYPDASSESFTYDDAGNRLTRTQSGQGTTSYAYDDAGQLTSAGGVSYTYDQAGNLTQAGSDTYAWDHDSRLLSATRGSHAASYTYDGDGVRVGATVDQAGSSFLVDREEGLPLVVGDGTTSYLHSGGLLEAVTGTQGSYALADRLGSIRGLANDAGALFATASYQAFGAPRSTSGTQSMFGFTDEPTDATGLVYLRARSLDPITGRMLSADTVVPGGTGTQGYNLYAYAADNPTTWTDPTGHFLSPSALASMAASGLALAPIIPSLAPQLIAALAITAAFLVLLCTFTEGCLADLFGFLGQMGQLWSHAFDGAFEQVIQELLDATYVFPEVPTVTAASEEETTDADVGWRVPEVGQVVYRVWGGGSGPWTPYWTPINPLAYGADKYREIAGLPDVSNAGTVMTVAEIINPSDVSWVGNAAPMGPPRSYCKYEGGLLEYRFRNPSVSLRPLQTVVLSPPYGGDPGPCR
jgi:RHS repeat-associated protein